MKIKLLNTSQANFNKRLNDHLSFKQDNYESVEKTVDKILKKIEENGVFTENVFAKGSNDKVKFFNKGPKNIWHNKLPENIRLELEDKLKNEMTELGYLETN